MAGYQKLDVLIREELDQLLEEGYDFSKDEYIKKIDSCGGDLKKLGDLYDTFASLKMRKDFGYVEPSTLEEIRALSDAKDKKDSDPGEVPFKYFHGAWLGRCIGCALGQPVEMWHYRDIRTWFENAGKYPINGFVPTHSGDKVNEGAATDEKINAMPMDDDIRFTVLSYMLVAGKGYTFDTYDVGAFWMYHLPYRYICTAENQAYLNFAAVDEFGPWGRPENALEILKKSGVNTYRNPYREWIGAQIRIDGYAYCAAGRPALAAEMAYNDAFLSHTKNGIYGAMFFAAFIAAAFTDKDPESCFETALSFIPKTSRFYETALEARRIAHTVTTTEELVDAVVEKMPHYCFVHTLNNAALCIASILFAKGDFAKALTASVTGGMDTDCNGATVGSFMGALCGNDNIPAHLKDPLNDTYYSGISGYDPGSISGLAKKFSDIANKR
ncbi:MAG TPA: ADP-ribosylglycohydrolase family protein [Bacillota bacterium]|nr:ADP-ribosylglycohydrolase family protein [Bacillota bacterium]